jgi:O-antigen ligase
VNRLVGWGIALLLSLAIWLLAVHLLVWAARTFGLLPAALGLVAIALVGLVLALVGVRRDLREARKPWREPTWAEREALR